MSSNLKYFVIGSSLPVILLFFLRVRNIPIFIRNFSYENYSLIAPLYFGIINIILNNWENEYKYIILSILSPIIVFLYSYNTKSYNFDTNEEWFMYFFRILIILIVYFSIFIFLRIYIFLHLFLLHLFQLLCVLLYFVLHHL